MQHCSGVRTAVEASRQQPRRAPSRDWQSAGESPGRSAKSRGHVLGMIGISGNLQKLYSRRLATEEQEILNAEE